MNTIHKLALNALDYQEIWISGPIISVAADRGGSSSVFDMWLEHHDDINQIKVGIYVIGTGNPVPWNEGQLGNRRTMYGFIGTVVTPSNLVWHIYQGPVR